MSFIASSQFRRPSETEEVSIRERTVSSPVFETGKYSYRVDDRHKIILSSSTEGLNITTDYYTFLLHDVNLDSNHNEWHLSHG